MSGTFVDRKCPLCGARLLMTEREEVYCSMAGCKFGLWEGFNVFLRDEEIVNVGGRI